MDLQWGQTVFQVLVLSVSKPELSLQKKVLIQVGFKTLKKNGRLPD